jgi:hypothetical protein
MIGLEDPFNSSQYTKRHKLVTAYILSAIERHGTLR